MYTKRTILLVEDNKITRKTQKIMLQKYGYEVITAESGEEAVIIITENRSIDCVLMDIDLGDGIDGTVAAKIIHKKRDIPLIFLSSHTEPEIVEKTEKITSYGYVVKNTGITVLDASIKMAFKLYDTGINLQKINNELNVSNEQLRVAVEELEASNEHLIQSENEILIKEKSLAESEKKYKSLMVNLPVGVFRLNVSNPEKLADANRALARINKKETVEEIIDIPVISFFEKPSDIYDLVDYIINQGSIYNKHMHLKRSDGYFIWCSITAACLYNSDGKPEWIQGIVEDVTEHYENEKKLIKINEEFNILITSMSSMIIGVSIEDKITHWNPYAELIFGIKSCDAINTKLCECPIQWDWSTLYQSIAECIIDDKKIRLDDMRFTKPDGKIGIIGLSVNPLKGGGDELKGFIILGVDLTDQRMMEQQLLQGRKLEAIGQLSAGVAHEINTPLQYIGDNLKFIDKSFSGILDILNFYQQTMLNTEDCNIILKAVKKAEEYSKKIKLEYLVEQMPKAIEQSLEGLNRVSKIVQSMKAFAHPGTGTKTPANINKAIENTLTVSRNEWKYECELELELDLTLPEVPCFESELNQVILNLIVNANDAIHEHKIKNNLEKGSITIRTGKDDTYAIIEIEDNGGGIPDKIKEKVFDPFFTTKEVGKGTGQGLPISYSIIVEKHKGMMYFESIPDKGTIFFIKIPLNDEG